MAAGAAAKKAFGLDSQSTYMPHLSLLYSDIDLSTREAVAREEHERLFCATSDTKLGVELDGFVADCIAVWYTPVEDMTLESWKAVAVIPLGGGGSG